MEGRRVALLGLIVVALAACGLDVAIPSPSERPFPTIAEFVELSDPQIGVAYPFTVLTHCGLDAVTIDGETWLFEGEPGLNAPPGFVNPRDGGEIVLGDENNAVFTSSGGVEVRLKRGGQPRNGGCL